MNADERRCRSLTLHHLCVSAYVCALAISVSVAQTSKPTATGLDALSDEVLMNELASRGMTTLLDRAFEVNRVPRAEQEGRRSLLALRQITDKNAKLTARQRQELLAKVVA